MIITDEMLTAAFRYRETNLWEYLDDSNVFAFRLSSGETGYCCVMGNSGKHLALGFYRGAKGFTSYLKTITMGMKQQKEMLEDMLTLDCINCDFTNSADTRELDKEAKAYIRRFAKANGFKIRRPNGWPDFTRHIPYKTVLGIVDERDAKDITEALNAAIAVAEKLQQREWTGMGSMLSEHGFDEKCHYPSKKGGKTVPFLIPKDNGTYEWSTTVLPAEEKEVLQKPKYTNMIVAARLKEKPHRGTLQCRLIHLPTPIGESRNGEKFFPSVLLCVKGDSQQILPVIPGSPAEEAPEQTLNGIASALLNESTCPETIYVADKKTNALLNDFCKKTGIRLEMVKEIPELYDAWDYMLMLM